MFENGSTPQIDPAFLTGVLQNAFGNPQVVLGEWDIQPLYAGLEYSSRLYRIKGQAQLAGIPRAWSLILKIVQPDAANSDPQGYSYWQREALIYQSGLLKDLPGGITAPDCYAVCTQPDGSVELWLEEVKDEFGPAWTLEHYASVARSLGEFNGAYLVGRPLPDAPWLSRDWLRKFMESISPTVDFIRRHPGHPLVKDIYPDLTLAETLAVWDLYPRLIDRLDVMPQTFCHGDAFRRNLFPHQGRVAAIDWSFAGIGPVGAEAAVLVGGGLGLGNFPTGQAKELEITCITGYLEGLRQAGYQPDPTQVRLAVLTTIGLQFAVRGVVSGIDSMLDQSKRERFFGAFEQPREELMKSNPHTAAYYQGVLQELLKLLGLRFTFAFLAHTANYALRLRR